jgi:hypothetical protein
MDSRNDSDRADAATRAMERVLRAERDAQASLAQARAQATSQLDAARDDALAIVNRALERGAVWQRGHAAALQGRLDALRARHVESAAGRRMPAGQDIAAAVERVADRLIGAIAGDAGDGTR